MTIKICAPGGSNHVGLVVSGLIHRAGHRPRHETCQKRNKTPPSFLRLFPPAIAKTVHQNTSLSAAVFVCETHERCLPSDLLRLSRHFCTSLALVFAELVFYSSSWAQPVYISPPQVCSNRRYSRSHSLYDHILADSQFCSQASSQPQLAFAVL